MRILLPEQYVSYQNILPQLGKAAKYHSSDADNIFEDLKDFLWPKNGKLSEEQWSRGTGSFHF